MINQKMLKMINRRQTKPYVTIDLFEKTVQLRVIRKKIKDVARVVYRSTKTSE